MKQPLRRELLLAFAVLFLSATCLTLVAVFLAFPELDSPGQAALFLGGLLVIYLLVFFFFGGRLLNGLVTNPLEDMVADVRRIAAGDLEHRLKVGDIQEFSTMANSVNEMAARLIRDQTLLADNVRSLERTNRSLVEARDEVLRSARLATVGTLASGIAHEVGNPLGAIIGYADVARSRAERLGQEVEMVDAIRSEAARIDSIVRSLLSFAAPQESTFQPLDMGEVLTRIRELLSRQGRLDAVRTEWTVVADVPRAEADLHRLEQVMVNLLLNALDALEGTPDGWIGVSVDWESGGNALRPLRREDDPPGVNYAHRRRVAGEDGIPDPLRSAETIVVIRVTDNGPGLPLDGPDRVFDPFFTTKDPGKGTGLGLAICARLVEGMGGRIEALNRAEGGAEFVLSLPGLAPEVDSADEEELDGVDGSAMGSETSYHELGASEL